MIIGYFDIIGILALPGKTNSPLIINLNTPLSFSLFSQFMQPVAWWNLKIVQADCRIEYTELFPGPGLYVSRKLLRYFPSAIKRFRFLAGETFDH